MNCPLRVLCVDDNQDAAVSTAEMLALEGFDARACHDGDTALRVAAEFHPDVCLLDLSMPGMNGVKLGRRLRAELPGPVRVIVVTAMWDVGSKMATKNAGFDGHLVKPVDPDRLVSVLKGEDASDPANPGTLPVCDP
ncbi:response regulator [Limnoglobus roseus]|uniref:Response regulator n=1 Tax=Limnoglobus roseus TaxID=2598579 RepID=A0A5C1AQT3_9BACT|nr:response regulator [Limnoglobus roseus]QEL20557.1 response regulator [Limnoglobus roseus]